MSLMRNGGGHEEGEDGAPMPRQSSSSSASSQAHYDEPYQASYLERHQSILEINEDLIAAVVENLQIGRLNDAFSHLSLLQHNLVNLGVELDHYPRFSGGNGVGMDPNPYVAIAAFPDEVMRKDVLEELKNNADLSLNPAPPQPLNASSSKTSGGGKVTITGPCAECVSSSYNAEHCRLLCRHIAPVAALASFEVTAYLQAAYGLYEEHTQRQWGASLTKVRAAAAAAALTPATSTTIPTAAVAAAAPNSGSSSSSGSGSGSSRGRGSGSSGGANAGTAAAASASSSLSSSSSSAAAAALNTGFKNMLEAPPLLSVQSVPAVLPDRIKSMHQHWTDHEKYTLLLGMGLYGPREYNMISGLMPGRSRGTRVCVCVCVCVCGVCVCVWRLP